MWRKSGLMLSALLCALLLALAPVISFSQSLGPTPPPSTPLTPQEQQQRYAKLMQILLSLRVVSLQLGSDLISWPQQIANLQQTSEQLGSQVQSLQKQLSDSAASFQDSQTQLLQTQAELDRSSDSLTALSQSYASYKSAAQAAQADLQQELAQERANSLKFEVAAGIGAAVIVGIAGYAGGHALHIW